MKTINKIIALAAALACFGLTGCATVFSGTTQPVHVQAIDRDTNDIVTNAKCQVVANNGSITPVGNNPGQIVVPRAFGALQTRCTSDTHRTTTLHTSQGFNPVVIADILFWPGAIVDFVTGAAAKYPSQITVPMTKTS